jgi:hypothetical protein
MSQRSVLIPAILLLCTVVYGQEKLIVSKANDFLSLLDDSQAAKARFKMSDDERFNWHYIPRERNGIPLKELNDKQRQAALAMLKVCLSEQGLQKANNIMALENVLRQAESRGADDTYRDPLNYSVTIFGNPAADSLWGWRLEGHHISLNFSSADGIIVSATPTFLGSNPATVRSGGDAGKQVLKQEMDLGFTLVNSLDPNQVKAALISQKAPGDIITGNQRQASLQEFRGIAFSDMKENQKKLLMQLLNVYVKNYQFGFAKRLMDKINKAGIENLSFAWAGSLQPGAGHYYRIQGPMLLIEFDNTQNNANHVHSVVRDLTNDFAGDILREHYEKEHN